jgi:inositol monophosphatase 3
VTAIKKWDLCAGHAILGGVAGTMSTLAGETLEYSADTNPKNDRGTLAYYRSTPLIQKLMKIKLPE